ncbi:unnamed protein product [Lymnaea stagnalis]|uniref:Nuclear envelope membrane protein n=1 Tax=Lymnaea stagnalis TaxID=6523 RepID=A0AAV2H7G1_LYMST
MNVMSTVKELSYCCTKNLHYVTCIIIGLLSVTAFGNFQMFVSKQSLSFWDSRTSVLSRFLWDLLLLITFIVQHSLMASSWFKVQMSSWLNISISERLIYLTVSSCTLLIVITQWNSIPEVYLWLVDTQRHFLLWLFFLLLHVTAWLLMCLEIILMDCGELLGFSQIYNHYNSLPWPMSKKARMLREIYSRMRHPGAILLTAMLWLHPLMTLDRLILACTLTSYIIGRHSFEMVHYEFAEKYFTLKTFQRESSVSYDYITES